MKVKILFEVSSEELERVVNTALNRIPEGDIVDIKLEQTPETSDYRAAHTAMIIYKDQE